MYIIAGSDFGDMKGCVIIIHKALYGLRSSGLMWHERLANCLRDMGFIPYKAEPDIWMRENDSLYEYIAVYIDDLDILAKHPKEIIDVLMNIHKFKLKDTGPKKYHLGCDFFRDEDGILSVP